MRLGIVGSRDYPNKSRVIQFVNSLPLDTVVVSGGARGVDTWAEEAALARGMEVVAILPDWETYGRAAGMIRNKEIVRLSDKVVAFHDGTSKGTANTIKVAQGEGKLQTVFLP